MSLTGDFETVLQIGGGTINRLLASMHQNGGRDSSVPSIPHDLSLAVGRPTPVSGAAGLLFGQVSVPRIELLDGSTDRFALELAVRARFVADPGSELMPAFIHARRIRAEYEFATIEDTCPGWQGRAEDHLWIKVDRDSIDVDFQADYDTGLPAAAHPEANARVESVLAHLLATTFAPGTFRAREGFRPGDMRSMQREGQSCVTVPVSLGGGRPEGDIASVGDIFLNGNDFALALDVDAILAWLDPVRDEIDRFQQDIPTPLADYTIEVDRPDLRWEGHGGEGLLELRVHGRANTDSEVLPDGTFDVSQQVKVTFDDAAGALRLTPGPREVHVYLAAGAVEKPIETVLNAFLVAPVAEACRTAERALGMGTAVLTDTLADQLRELDWRSSARLDAAEFGDDAVVLRGNIKVSPRRRPAATFRLDGSAFNARESWIPGGRIDELRWSWRWFNFAGPGALGGVIGESRSFTDRYVLQPGAADVTRFGRRLAVAGEEGPVELPGIDGPGRVCLRLKGQVVNAETGELDDVETEHWCTSYGVDLRGLLPLGPRSRMPDLRVPVQERAPGPPFPPRPVGLAATPDDRGPSCNVLLVRFGERWDEQGAQVLEAALEQESGKEDTALLVVLLLDAALLGSRGAEAGERLAELAGRARAPMMALADEGGQWAQVMGLPGTAVAWRLHSPGGGLVWAHDGHLEPDVLARVLDEGLSPSAGVRPFVLRPGLGVGAVVWPGILEAGERVRRCPPPPLKRADGTRSRVLLLNEDAATAARRMGELPRDDAAGDLRVVVAQGLDADAVASLREAAPPDVTVLADAAGDVARRMGVQAWPMTVTIDDGGTIVAARFGADDEREEA